MGSMWLILTAIIAFVIAYSLYGKYVGRKLGINPLRETPAHTIHDGIDYIPARAPVLLGHHFASIAGAAPIIGPIVAALFGWLPVMLWIFIGSIFMGAVHDFSALIASVRHGGRSIGEVIEEEIGYRGKILFLIFSWSALTLVVAVFIIVVSRTFESVPSAATASILFIAAALIIGFLLYKLNLPLAAATIIGIIMLAASLYIGYLFPINLSALTWTYILLGYIFVASTSPVWVLLQPRDYLNSFILYALMILSVIGIIYVNPEIKIPAFTSFKVEKLGYLFPILFVTVACGAISGFHSLVASGTSAKQLNNEKDAKLVGYGSMLIESLLAIVALITAAILIQDKYHELKQNPVEVFAYSLGNIMTPFGIDFESGKMFASLAVSAFALTSLDTAARLSRFAFQEFFYKKNSKHEDQSIFFKNRYLATLIGVVSAGLLVISGQGLNIWPIFGSANQLLSALALLSVTVWLTRHNKKKNMFIKIPMIVMFIITLSALVLMIVENINEKNFILTLIASILFLLAAILALEARNSIKDIK
ncbi:MAG: carbon starvation protein A [Spirochaetota bacterium]|nr:carbon starvation protein A [Spirochaetota bacterium]